MLEKFGNQNRGFDEGKHIDIGEIDPNTGKRIFDNPASFDTDGNKEEPKFTFKEEEKGKFPVGVCEYCKQDPCNNFCPGR